MLNLPPIQAYELAVPSYSPLPLPCSLIGSKMHLMQSVSKLSDNQLTTEVVDRHDEYRDSRFEMTTSSEVNT